MFAIWYAALAIEELRRFSREERHRRPSINSSEDLRIRPTPANNTVGDIQRVCKRTCANNKNQTKPEPCCSFVKVKQNISKDKVNKRCTSRSGTQTYSGEDVVGKCKSLKEAHSMQYEHDYYNRKDASTQNYGAHLDPVEERNGECFQEDGKCYITNYEIIEDVSLSRSKNKVMSKSRRRFSLNNDTDSQHQRYHRQKFPDCDCNSPGPQSIIQCTSGSTCNSKSTEPFTTVLDSKPCRPVTSEISDIINARKALSNNLPCECIESETSKSAICADCQSCGLPTCEIVPPAKVSDDSMTGLSDVLLEKYRKSDTRPQQYQRPKPADRRPKYDGYDDHCLSDAIIGSVRNFNKSVITGKARKLSAELKDRSLEDTRRGRLTYAKPKYTSDRSSNRTYDQRYDKLRGGMDGSSYHEKKTIEENHAPHYEQVLERDSLYDNLIDEVSEEAEQDVNIEPNCDCNSKEREDSSSGSDNFKNKRKRKPNKGPILYNDLIKRRTIKNLYIEVHPNMEILRLEETRNPLQKFSTDMNDIILAKCRKRAGQSKNSTCSGKGNPQRLQNQRVCPGQIPVIPVNSSGTCNNCLPGDKCKNKTCPANITPRNGIDVVQAEERFIAASRVRDTCASSSCSYKPDYKRSGNSVCIENRYSQKPTKNNKIIAKTNFSCSNYSCKGSRRNASSCISLKVKGCKGSIRNTYGSSSYDRYKGGKEISMDKPAHKEYHKGSHPCSNINCRGSKSRSSCKSLKMKGCGPSETGSSRILQSNYIPSRSNSCRKYSQETVAPPSRIYSLDNTDGCGCNKSSKKSKSNTLYINAIPSGSLRCQECNTEELKESLSRIKESDTEIIVGYKKVPGNKTCCISKISPSNIGNLKETESLEIYCTPSNASSIRNKCSGECSNIPIRPSPKITPSVMQTAKCRLDATKKCTPKLQSVICSQLCTPKVPYNNNTCGEAPAEKSYKYVTVYPTESNVSNEKLYRDCGTTKPRSTSSIYSKNTRSSRNVGECTIDEEMEDACCNTPISKKINVNKSQKNYWSNTSYSDYSKPSTTSVKLGRTPYKPYKCYRGKSATNRLPMDSNCRVITPRNASTASDIRRVKQTRILCQECNTDSDDIIYETAKSVSIGPEIPAWGSGESVTVINETPTCCTARKSSPKRPKPQTGIVVYAPCDDCGTQVERQRPPPPPPPLPPPQPPPVYICNTSECIQARPPDCGQFMTRETSGRTDACNLLAYDNNIQYDSSKLTVNLQPMACEEYSVRPCKQCASSSSDSFEQGFFSRLFGCKPSRTQTSAANTEPIRTYDECVSPPRIQIYEEKETNYYRAKSCRSKSSKTQTSINTEGPYTCDQSVSPPCKQRYIRKPDTCVDRDPYSTCAQYDAPPCNECSTNRNNKWSVSKLFGCSSCVDTDRDSTCDQYDAAPCNECFPNRKAPFESLTSYEDCGTRYTNPPEPYDESDGSVMCAPIISKNNCSTKMEKPIKTCNSCTLCIAGNKKTDVESPESVSRDTCDIILDKSPRRRSGGNSNNLDIFDEVVPPKCREQVESEGAAGCYQSAIIKPSETTLDSCGCSDNPNRNYFIPTEPMDCCVNLCIQRSRQHLDRNPQKIRLSLFKRYRMNKSKYNNESEYCASGRNTAKRDRRCESRKKFSREMDDIILDRCNRASSGQDRRETKCSNKVFDEVIPKNKPSVRIIKNESLSDSSDSYEPPSIKPCTCSTRELISVQTSNIQSCCTTKNNRDKDRDRERDRDRDRYKHVSIEYDRRNRCKGSRALQTCKIDEYCDTDITKRPKPISCADFCSSCPVTDTIQKPQRIERDNGTSCAQFCNDVCPTINRSQKVRDKPTHCNTQAQSERYPCKQNIKLVRCELKIYNKTDITSQKKSICKFNEPKKITCNETCGNDVVKTDAVTTCSSLTQNQDAVCYAYNQKKIEGEVKCTTNKCTGKKMGPDASCYAYKQNKYSGKICRKETSSFKRPAKCKDVCVNHRKKLLCPASSLVVAQRVNKRKCIQETVIEQIEEEEQSSRKSPCGRNAPCKQNPCLRIDVTAGNIVPCNLEKCKVVEDCNEACPNKIKTNLKQCYDDKCRHPYYCNNKCGRKEEERKQFRSENDIVLMEKEQFEDNLQDDSNPPEPEKEQITNISCKENKTCNRQKCANIEDVKPDNTVKENEDKKKNRRDKTDQRENSASEESKDSISTSLTQSSKISNETTLQESKEKDDTNILSLYSLTSNFNQENLKLCNDIDDICNNICVKKPRKLSDFNQKLPERAYVEKSANVDHVDLLIEAHRGATRLIENVISEEEIIIEATKPRNSKLSDNQSINKHHPIATMFGKSIDTESASIIIEEKEILPKPKYVKRLSSNQSTNVIDSSKNNKFKAINKEMETDFPSRVQHKIARGEEFEQFKLTSENQGVSARPDMDNQEVSVKCESLDETIEFDYIDDSCTTSCKRRKTRNGQKGISMETNTMDTDNKHTIIKNQSETVSAKPIMNSEEILVKPTSANKKTTSNITSLKNVKQKAVATEIYEEYEETTTLQKKPVIKEPKQLNPKTNIDMHEESKQLSELGTQVTSKNFTKATCSNVTEDRKEEMEECTFKPGRRVCIKGEEIYERKISKTSLVGSSKVCTEDTVRYKRNLSREEMFNKHKMSEGLNCLTDCLRIPEKPPNTKLPTSADVKNISSNTAPECRGGCIGRNELNKPEQGSNQRKVHRPSNLQKPPSSGCTNKQCPAKYSPKQRIPKTSTYLVLSTSNSSNDLEKTCVPRCPGVSKNKNQQLMKTEKNKINTDYNKYQSSLTARKPESHPVRMLRCKDIEQKIFCNQPRRVYDNSRTAEEYSTSAEIIGEMESREGRESQNFSTEQISEVILPELGYARTVKSKPLQPICSTIGNTKHDVLFYRKLKKKCKNIEDKPNKYMQPLNKQFSKAGSDVILIDKTHSSRTSRIPKVKGDYVIVQINEDDTCTSEEFKSENNSIKRGRITSHKDTNNNEHANRRVLEELIYSSDELSIFDQFPDESRSLTNISLDDIEYESLSDEDICGSLTIRPPKDCMDKKQKKK